MTKREKRAAIKKWDEQQYKLRVWKRHVFANFPTWLANASAQAWAQAGITLEPPKPTATRATILMENEISVSR